MSVGKRIYLQRNMPDPELVEAFKQIPASNTADVMGRSCAMNPRIKLVSSPKAQMMAGPAYTVKCRAGDNLTLHAALNFCHEGDVLVVSNEEDDTRALMGEVMMAYLYLTKKVAGIILDGPIRDIDEIGKWDFPVYCTGTTPGGPYKEGPGEINVPISCGGISVNPGDIILADPDGIICIPRKDAASILVEARKFQEADEKKLIAARNGTATGPGWRSPSMRRASRSSTTSTSRNPFPFTTGGAPGELRLFFCGRPSFALPQPRTKGRDLHGSLSNCSRIAAAADKRTGPADHPFGGSCPVSGEYLSVAGG